MKFKTIKQFFLSAKNNPDLFELVSVVKFNIEQTQNGLERDILSKALPKDKKLIWGYTNIEIQKINYKKSELAIDGNVNWIKANAKKVKIQFNNNEYFLKDYLDQNINNLIQPDEIIKWNEFDIYNSEIQYIQEKKTDN